MPLALPRPPGPPGHLSSSSSTHRTRTIAPPPPKKKLQPFLCFLLLRPRRLCLMFWCSGGALVSKLTLAELGRLRTCRLHRARARAHAFETLCALAATSAAAAVRR